MFELRPFQLHLELTNLCNANCVFCSYSQQLRPHERMSERVFKKAVDDYVAMGGGSIDLTPAVGDVLIHPKFVEWVRYLRSFPQIDQIAVTTNGILLDRHGAEQVLDSGLSWINVSLAGFDEAMYRRLYRSKAYKRVRANIADLLAANARRETPVEIVLCLRPDRPEQDVLSDPDLQPLLRYKPRIEVLKMFSRAGGLINSVPEGLKLAPVPKTPKRQPCRSTYVSLIVQSNGDVRACGCESSVNAPALVVGNIEEESLQEIWRGERMRALRRSFTDGTLNPNCAACDYYYAEPGFHMPEMRRMADKTKRRMRGEIIRHSKPPKHNWVLE